MTLIPVAEFMPDMPDLADATNIALNVIPRTPESYGPVSDTAAYSSNTLGAPCIGMIGVQDIDDTVYIFAGTAATLQEIAPGSAAWADVSKLGGYAAGSTGNWRFAQFKQIVIATDLTDPPQAFTLASSTLFADLSADAPRAAHIAVAKNFCILANTDEAIGGANPSRIWWSANGAPASWPTPGSSAAQAAQSDFSDLLGPQGDITGLAPNLTGCDCAVFFQRGVQRMIYVGPPDIFDFYPAENVRGTRASNSIVPLGNLVYYLAEDGFYSFDGNASTPIGLNKVDKWFFSNLNQGFLYNVIGTADVVNKAIMWAFPSNASGMGVPDTILFFRWDIQRWAYANINLEWLSRAIASGLTMDSMAAAGFTDVDTLPASLDSRVWLGGAPQTATVDANGALAYFNGATLQAQVGTKAAQLFADKLGYVQAARPLVDGGVPTIAISARQTYYEAETFGADVPPNAMGECPQRSTGRYHRARITVPAGASWTQALGVDATAIPAGWR